jgi:competence ComEA-like helix-hairpin-helix protein
MRHRMWLLVLFVVIAPLNIASCKSRETAPLNAAVIATPHANNESGAEPNRQQHCLNLNIATAGELTTLPGVGDVIAKRIIDYRERHGRFRRPQEIIIIEGFSERKFRAIAALVCV